MQKEKISQKDYIREMKLEFSDKDMIDELGNINHPYFLNKKWRYWSTEKENELYACIEKYGIGNWEEMKETQALNKFSKTDLEFKSKQLLNTSDISSYNGIKLKKKDILELAKLSEITVNNEKKKNELN